MSYFKLIWLQLNDGVRWHLDNPSIQVFISFTIKITASHLRTIIYSPYQHELWKICNSMREEGATFLAIAKYLNEIVINLLVENYLKTHTYIQYLKTS